MLRTCSLDFVSFGIVYRGVCCLGWRYLWNACQVMPTSLLTWNLIRSRVNLLIECEPVHCLAFGCRIWTERGRTPIDGPHNFPALPFLNSSYSALPWYFWDITGFFSKLYLFSSVGTQEDCISRPPCSWIGALWLSFGQWSVGWIIEIRPCITVGFGKDALDSALYVGLKTL